MKVTKSAVHRITAGTGCECVVLREYEDADYKKPMGDAVFTPCKKHKGQPGVDIIEMILGELVEKEATEHVAAPAVNAPRPNAAATVNADGELEMRVPINVRPVGKVAVRPAGTAQRPVPGRTSAQAGRTGPVKFERPTASTPKTAASSGLSAALAEDDVEDDLLAQNDPEKAY